jgi:hypothetical protein
MFNTRGYQQQTIDTFELLGGYVVGVFYNNMYDKAKELHQSGKATSTTEAYKAVCRLYLAHFNKEDQFKSILRSLYDYSNIYSPIPLLSYSDWIDKTTKEFIPSDYWISLNSKQKDHFLGVIVEGVFRNFGIIMLSPKVLNMVIDAHHVKSNVPFLQDKMLNVMIEEREKLYQKFIKPLSGSKSESIAERLREDLVKISKKYEVMKTALQNASNTIKEQASKIDQLQKEKEYLITRARDIHSEMVKLQTAPPTIQYIAQPIQDTKQPYTISPTPPSPPKLEMNEVSIFQQDSPQITSVEAEEVPPLDMTVDNESDNESIEEIKERAKNKRKEKIAVVPSTNTELETDNLF